MRLVAVAVASVVVLLAGGAARGADALDEIAADPPATGALVVRVAPDGPGERAGVRPGDVVTHYAGAAVTGMQDLTAGVAANAKVSGTVELTYVRRDGGPVAVRLPPGRVGVLAVGVERGKPRPLRPPATDAAFDLAPYRGTPRDQWYAYQAGGAHTGFQHDRIEVQGDRVVLTSELAYEGPAGLWHTVLAVTATAGPRPQLVEARYEILLPRPAVGTLKAVGGGGGGGGGGGKLAVRLDEGGGKVRERTLDLTADTLLDQFAFLMSPAMPMKPGACMHYRMVGVVGDTADPAAMHVGEAGEVEVGGGRKVSAVPVTTFAWGEKARTAWVDPATRAVVKLDYGKGAAGVPATREQAVAGVNAKLKPRT